MNQFRLTSLIIALLFLIIMSGQSNTITWNIQEKWGLNQNGIINATSAAKNHFASFPQDTIILSIPTGTFNIGGNNSHSIDVSDIRAGEGGRLIFEGAGKDKTTLVATDRKEHSIYGRNMYRITFKGIHFTRDYNTVTQGTVVSVDRGEVILDLHQGFPTPDSLMAIGRQNSAGLYLRKYTNDIDNPQIIQNNNIQQAWDTAGTYQINGTVWRIGLKNKNAIAPYTKGDIIGVKLKHGGQTYWFSGGDDIAFEDCKWTQKTRGVLRGGIGNIRFSNCTIERAPRVGGRTPCLASPGGGPQCGQPNDPIISNVIVEDCDFSASGDDNIGFFRINGGLIKNCKISDAFARGILLHKCVNICLDGNVLIRNPLLWEEGDGVSICNGATDINSVQRFDNQNTTFNIYPNPFNNSINIERINPHSSTINLKVSNLKGETIVSQNRLDFNNGSTKKISFDKFSEGTYFLTLFNEDFRTTEQIVKSK